MKSAVLVGKPKISAPSRRWVAAKEFVLMHNCPVAVEHVKMVARPMQFHPTLCRIVRTLRLDAAMYRQSAKSGPGREERPSLRAIIRLSAGLVPDLPSPRKQNHPRECGRNRIVRKADRRDPGRNSYASANSRRRAAFRDG